MNITITELKDAYKKYVKEHFIQIGESELANSPHLDNYYDTIFEQQENSIKTTLKFMNLWLEKHELFFIDIDKYPEDTVAYGMHTENGENFGFMSITKNSTLMFAMNTLSKNQKVKNKVYYESSKNKLFNFLDYFVKIDKDSKKEDILKHFTLNNMWLLPQYQLEVKDAILNDDLDIYFETFLNGDKDSKGLLINKEIQFNHPLLKKVIAGKNEHDYDVTCFSSNQVHKVFNFMNEDNSYNDNAKNNTYISFANLWRNISSTLVFSKSSPQTLNTIFKFNIKDKEYSESKFKALCTSFDEQEGLIYKLFLNKYLTKMKNYKDINNLSCFTERFFSNINNTYLNDLTSESSINRKFNLDSIVPSVEACLKKFNDIYFSAIEEEPTNLEEKIQRIAFYEKLGKCLIELEEKPLLMKLKENVEQNYTKIEKSEYEKYKYNRLSREIEFYNNLIEGNDTSIFLTYKELNVPVNIVKSKLFLTMRDEKALTLITKTVNDNISVSTDVILGSKIIDKISYLSIAINEKQPYANLDPTKILSSLIEHLENLINVPNCSEKFNEILREMYLFNHLEKRDVVTKIGHVKKKI